jgi:hypothetical protein
MGLLRGQRCSRPSKLYQEPWRCGRPAREGAVLNRRQVSPYPAGYDLMGPRSKTRWRPTSGSDARSSKVGRRAEPVDPAVARRARRGNGGGQLSYCTSVSRSRVQDWPDREKASVEASLMPSRLGAGQALDHVREVNPKASVKIVGKDFHS